MLSLNLIVIFIALAVGIIAKYIMDYIKFDGEINWTEFAIGSALICLVIVPASVKIGWNVAKSNTVTYHEYWNGWEMAAIKQDIRCERDGSCYYDYDCDPYSVEVCDDVCTTDSEGERNCHKECHDETRYHSCPYSTVETNYSVNTTLGSYQIASHRFPDNPQSHRWRRLESIPSHVISSAGTGEPPFWVGVKKRVKSGKPGPVTKVSNYKNYILASDNTILKKYSREVDFFNKKRLLPAFQVGVYGHYLANKVSFVGKRPSNQKEWQDAVGYLNSAAGKRLEGDVHIVIVNNTEIEKNPDKYSLALQAHWQNRLVLGKNSLSKNTIVVVIGTSDGELVSWARAFTGMPVGNEQMIATINNSLKGEKFDPKNIIGDVVGAHPACVGRVSEKCPGRHLGTLEKIIFGVDNSKLKFRRISMSGTDKNDNGSGFLYLYREVIVPKGAKWAIGIVTFLICSIVWVVFAVVDVGRSNRV